VLFGLGPSYMFLVKNRLPVGLMRSGWRYWASAILFYVQHQFEETQWETGEDWRLHDAALHGSSHYV
jgi:acyl-lipid omega-6 desaturase (Delta-12 desaturase)